MSHWRQHIASWAAKNNRDPDIVENILVKKGWDPSKYSPGMEKDLNYYLDQWYTLAVKKLPIPATASKRRNPYRRNADTSLRELQRRMQATGDVSDALAYAAALDRAGKPEEATELRLSLWGEVVIDLSELAQLTVEARQRAPLGVTYQESNLETYDLGYPKAGYFIPVKEFLAEWHIAEEGSWEDHGRPEDGHVYNIIDRSEDSLVVNSLQELKDLISSISSNTAGLNYADRNGNTCTPILLDGETEAEVCLPDLYGEMKWWVINKMKKLQNEFEKLIGQ